ncbi:MAG: FKBP-type peptidyl-prolyl cis-trans isomerase [Pseudomonadales bacterium]|nr:FKBP-type peptidyl-prolyl cis-trans isomerase [Pseudomonadales bacterium]MCP5345995.1 FKBP-type peptidyl-prolyl cis-trans isomerase [Pseudomonadales bacterium]
MVKTLGFCSLISLVGLANSGLAQDVDLQNEDNRIAYSIGVNIGQNLVQQQLLEDLDFEAFVMGLRDLVNGEPQLSNEEIIASIQTFQQRMMERQNAERDAARSYGEEFLAANAEKDGVVVLDSGLQYLVLESGDNGAESPSATDSVLAHYHGTLIDGSVFDSSVDRGEPAQFALNQVIPGWTEALQLMKVGDKWRIFIPYELAYGEQGIPGAIPPFATLIFDVELLEVNP